MSSLTLKWFALYQPIDMHRINLLSNQIPVFQAKFQEECEKERRTTEVSKERMQEELLKKASFRRTKQVMEEERQRRIQEMEALLTDESEESIAMADTNARLSLVHEDLLNAFRTLEVMQLQRMRGFASYLLHSSAHCRTYSFFSPFRP